MCYDSPALFWPMRRRLITDYFAYPVVTQKCNRVVMLLNNNMFIKVGRKKTFMC